MRRGVIGLFLGAWLAVSASATTIGEAIEKFELVELVNTLAAKKIDRLLPSSATWIAPEDRAAAAVLLAIGIIEDSNLMAAADVERKLDQEIKLIGGSAEEIVVSLDDVSALMRLANFGGHEKLRRAAKLTHALDRAIAAEVLTGYGLRKPHVSAGTDPTRTVIYSHSSLPHVKQLVGLVASEGLRGEVYIAPKIAAFVFRDGWGERPEWINELSPGLYVAQGPEMLVHFEFENVSDRQRFDALVNQYAKKDTEDETGNIIHSWWQPFYYGETSAEGYSEIHRVTLFSKHAEASLLMLAERTKIVRSHFEDTTEGMVIDSIWVSAPFYRFLQGDYK